MTEDIGRMTLDELEGELGEVSRDSSLSKLCLLARSKRIDSLRLDEIRLLLTQKMGLKYLVPLALSSLERDPLISAGLYRGDLLVAVLNIPVLFWDDNFDMNNRLVEVGIDVAEIERTLSAEVIPLISRFKYK